VSKRKKRNMKW